MDTQCELEEVKINSFINDMSDTKQAVVNLLDTLKKMNLALSVIADNQNHLNSKINKLLLSKKDNDQDKVDRDKDIRDKDVRDKVDGDKVDQDKDIRDKVDQDKDVEVKQ